MDTEHYHIAFLHTKFSRTDEDMYLIDAALALGKHGHQVTIFTSSYDKMHALAPVHPIRGKLRVVVVASWMPRTIFGKFGNFMDTLTSLWMAFKLVTCPPNPTPKSIILDADPSALLMLSWCAGYDTIYIHHCSELQKYNSFHNDLKIDTKYLTKQCLACARTILVKSEALLNVVERSFPDISDRGLVLYPCYNTGVWSANTVIDIKSIVPNLSKNYSLFVAFGDYVKRSNFGLILRILECIYIKIEPVIRKKIHIVIAGNCKEGSDKQELHYRALVRNVDLQPYSSNITFLKKVTSAQAKSLTLASTAILHPVYDDPFPGPVLAAMKMGCPVIALRGGFADEILLQDLSVLLVDPNPYAFVKLMRTFIFRNSAKLFLSVLEKDKFDKLYSFDVFAKRLNDVILRKIQGILEDSEF